MKIVWTSLAKKSYNETIIYLVNNWNLVIVQDFILEVERTMGILKHNPYCFQKWDYDTSFYKGHIHKNVSFYNKVYSTEVVVYLFGTIIKVQKK